MLKYEKENRRLSVLTENRFGEREKGSVNHAVYDDFDITGTTWGTHEVAPQSNRNDRKTPWLCDNDPYNQL